jgi:hypothetical protein
MSRLRFTKVATPSTPAANKSEMFIDTTDRRAKQIDDNGVISTLNNVGPGDENILTNGGFKIQQRVAAASTAIPGITTSTRAGQVADCWAVTTSVASNLNWAQIDSETAGAETGLLARITARSSPRQRARRSCSRSSFWVRRWRTCAVRRQNIGKAKSEGRLGSDVPAWHPAIERIGYGRCMSDVPNRSMVDDDGRRSCLGHQPRGHTARTRQPDR